LGTPVTSELGESSRRVSLGMTFGDILRQISLLNPAYQLFTGLERRMAGRESTKFADPCDLSQEETEENVSPLGN
jgi:hypothetical protein